MYFSAERCFFVVFVQNGNGIVVGVAGMDNQRQAGLLGGNNLFNEDFFLNIGRRIVVILIQSAFSDSHHFFVM